MRDDHRLSRFAGVARGAALVCALPGVLAAQAAAPATPSPGLTDSQVRAALEVLPEGTRSEATVLVLRNDVWTVTREGTNHWRCRIRLVRERLAVNCHHAVLTAMLDRADELNREGADGKTALAALAADVHQGTVAIPTGAVEVTASGEVPSEGEVPDRMRGWYFVYFPFSTPDDLSVSETPDGSGAPYLHFAGTAKAHLMWPREYQPSEGPE